MTSFISSFLRSKQPQYVHKIDSLKETTNKTMTQYINDLVQSDTITKWDEHEHTEQYNKIKRILIRSINIEDEEIIQHRFPYCWIVPLESIEHIEDKYRIAFDFGFKIVIPHKNELYYSTFNATYHQIQAIHYKAYNSNLFPTAGYPTVHPDVIDYRRTEELNKDIKLEDLYMVLEDKLKFDGPGKYLIRRTPRKAKQKDLDHSCIILNKLFNCPAFAINDVMYDILNGKPNKEEKKYDAQIEREDMEYKRINIHKDLILLLKHKAYRKLKEWRHHLRCQLRLYHIQQPIISNDKKVVSNVCQFRRYNQNTRKYTIIVKNDALSELFDSTYHSVFGVFKVGNPFMDHWALILEGTYYLLLIEYLHETVIDINGEKKIPFVSYKVFPNNSIGQRACWYSASDNALKKEQFNIRWSTLRASLYLKKSSLFGKDVNFRYIHDLVDKVWMNDPDYYVTTNNCQHFVRNILAVLDPKQAKFLNNRLDQKNMATPIPSGPVADQISQLIMMQRFVDAAKEKVQFKKCRDHNNYITIIKKLDENVFIDDDDDQKQDEKQLKMNRNNVSDNNNLNDDDVNERMVNLNGNDVQEEEEEEEEKNQLNDDVSINGEEYDSENDYKREVLIRNDDIDGDKEQLARNMLLDFEIPPKYIDNIIVNLKEEQLIDPKDWEYMYDEMEYLMNTIGFDKVQSRKFKKRYSQWLQQQNISNS